MKIGRNIDLVLDAVSQRSIGAYFSYMTQSVTLDLKTRFNVTGFK